ncbi:MAG TPA: DUF3972 domain-containing protein [Sulfurimonas sp.]|nr:DUF3972 domain-containing protein [Sulfurimonas sp.]
MSNNWITIQEYSELTGLTSDAIDDLMERGKLECKKERGKIYIDPSHGMQAIVPTEIHELTEAGNSITIGPDFIEKTIGTIINLHEKVLDAKDETIESVKSENVFLKEALSSLQELYEEDRNTIDTLTKQLNLSQDEVEFMKRKYKLMWGKVIDEYADNAPVKETNV